VIQTEDVESRMLRRILGLGKAKEQDDGRKFYKKELRNFYLSQNIISVIKRKRMRANGTQYG
jgi:hypothetical protein